MQQRLSLITLGVADLSRARAFYEKLLGWTVAESPPGIVFFDLNGLIFSLYPHDDLAADMTQPGTTGFGQSGSGHGGFALSHNLASKAEVDAFFTSIAERGVTIVKPPQTADWGGHSGYFADPDGHKWEVAYNPFWTVLPNGRISLAPPRQ